MRYNKFWKFIMKNVWMLQFGALFSYIFFMIIIYSINGYSEDISRKYTELGLWWTIPSMFITIVMHNIAFRLKLKEEEKIINRYKLSYDNEFNAYLTVKNNKLIMRDMDIRDGKGKPLSEIDYELIELD